MHEQTRIAIVGIGCKLPGGVEGPNDLVRFLEENGDGVTDVPSDRWSVERFYSPNKEAPGRSYVKRAAFLKRDVYSFDPVPFALSPREAEVLDPQQRLLLEVAWEAFEDAGLDISKLKASPTGVYIGAFMQDMRDITSHPQNRDTVSAQTPTGTSATVLSNRLSYTFDLRGPSFTVDTACSSSLVAIHSACLDLRNQTTDLAVAGGVNVMLSPLSTLVMCKGHFLAADGRSKSFDDLADGYGRGEGAALVVLKRLSDAVRDGDRIYATILASGVNQDGKTDGMPMPNPEAQEELARKVSSEAGIAPERLGYVEAHGTGTRAGDPIEVSALSSVYSGDARTMPLPIGSIKSNMGHLEAAAGVAGLVKAALSIYHEKLFPLRALGTPNRDIAFADQKVRIPLSSESWPAGLDRTAAVNSFGYGGTNAHAVLGPAPTPSIQPQTPDITPDENLRLLPISAFDDAALKDRARGLREIADERPRALASTLAHHRVHLPVRAAVVMGTKSQTQEALQALSDGIPHPRVLRGREGESRRLLWVYTGMGPQWWGMGQELYQKEPIYRQIADEIEAIFAPLAGFSLLAEMNKPESLSEMDRNRIAQPANFVVQAGYTALLRHYGAQVDGILGHSVGELAAAWASGCLSLEDAVRAAFHRSDLQDQVAGQGGMLAAAIPLERAEDFCRRYGDIAVAAINAATSTALSGSVASLKKVEAELTEQGVFARMMRVEVAYHSHQMDPLHEGFMTRLAYLRPQAPGIPLYSTALGCRVTDAVHDAAYFWKNARRPVYLQEALEQALSDGFDGFLEIGPHPVLGGAIQENARNAGKAVRVFASLQRKAPERESLAANLGNLFTAGCRVDWERLAPRESRIELPSYPFQLKRHWNESPLAQAYRLGRQGAAALLDQMTTDGTGWTTELDDNRFGWLSGHQVLGTKVFPGAGYIDLALSAAQERDPHLDGWAVEDLRFDSALVLPDEGMAEISAHLSGEALTIWGRTSDSRQLVAQCRVSGRSRFLPLPHVDRTRLCSTMTEFDVERLYARFETVGLVYSGPFRGIEQAWVGDGEAVALLRREERGGHLVFPPTLDATFQLLLACTEGALERALVPVRVRLARLVSSHAAHVYCHVRSERTATGVIASVSVFDETGEVSIRIEGLECEPVERQQGLRKSELSWIHRREWVEAELVPTEGSTPLHVVFGDAPLGATLVSALKEAGQTIVEPIPSTGPVHVVFVAARINDEIGSQQLAALTLLTQHLVTRGESRLTLVTQGAYEVGDEGVLPDQSGLAGFARVVMTEHPELRTRVLDAPPFSNLHPSALVEGIVNLAEEEAALRGGEWRALRIVRSGTENIKRRALRRPPAPGEVWELHVTRPGSLDSLVYRPRELGELGEHEVEVAVQASGLNFKDVMKGMGMLDETALFNTYFGTQLGIEASGIVTRVGAKVSLVAPGDHVYASVGRSLASTVRLHENFAVGAAKGHRPHESCSYLVFLTAWHALVDKAQLKKGERVLIHSAAGGVGLAAIQLAQHIGAELYVTAGTEEKRQYLKGLGIQHVFDSRTLDFADQIRTATSGQGVDVVLNQLAGEFLRRSFELLRAGGRFVEIGKQDISQGRELPLLPFNRALSFFAIDLDRMCFEAPDFFRPLARSVVEAFEKGVLRPLPTEVISASEVESAFRKLGSGAHVGKIVIDFSAGVNEIAPGMTPKPLFRRDASYLVTGGLGGFGLRTAEWIMKSGGGAVILAGRRGALSEDDAARIGLLSQRTGCAVECCALDVTERDEVEALVSRLSASRMPLRGIFHSAMVLDDRPIKELDLDSLGRVMLPKALGAHYLHLASLSVALDHFVLYSSVSAIVGNPGQAAYSAANAFLDGVALARRSRGLPATAVHWGALSTVGVVSRDEQVERHLRSIGIVPVDPDRGLAVLGELLREERDLIGIINIDWDRWVRSSPDTNWRRLTSVLEGRNGGSVGAQKAAELLSLDEAEHLSTMTAWLSEAIAPIFRIEPSAFDSQMSLKDYGLDSILALELQVAIERSVGVELSSMEILSGRPVRGLAEVCLARLFDGAKNQAAAPVRTVAVKSSSPELPAGDLCSYFLERICVQQPYFALRDIQKDGDWLTAWAHPAAPVFGEKSAVAVAEAARHLAILGSCSCRLEHSAVDGRIYYPVKSSTMAPDQALTLAERLDEIFIRSRCVMNDEKRSIARAQTELYDPKGSLVCSFIVDYHVIAEADFARLFADHAQLTNEKSGRSPYDRWEARPAEMFDLASRKLKLGRLSADECLGHFVGFPAYPVSIMLRDAVALVGAVVERENPGQRVRVSVVGGSTGTERFVFANEEAELALVSDTAHADGRVFRCEVSGSGKLAAWFEMIVQMERSDALTVSGFISYGADDAKSSTA